MPSPLLRPLTPATEAYQQEQQAMAPINQQAAEMDTIAQAQASEQAFAKQVQGQAAEAERAQRKQIAEQKAQESRQKEMLANAKRAGVKTTFDGGGQEQPVLHPDGQPVFEHGFQGDVQPGDNGHTVDYRDPRGRVYKVPTKAIRSTQDPAGNPLYEFNIKKEDGTTDTIRQPVGSKPLWNTDPKTGDMYTGAPDPETGSYGQTKIGVDTTVAGKAALARQKELFDQQQAERKFQSDSLMLDQNVRETNLAPVKKQLTEAQAAAKKMAKAKVQYKETPEGYIPMQDFGNGLVEGAPIPSTDPSSIVKAKAWLEQKAATDKALADAKTAHDPLAAEVQTMQQKRDQLAIEALNHSRSAQVQMMQMEKAQKAGLPIHEPDWQKRIAAARTDPRITSIFSQAELDQMGGPLAEDAKRVSLPETTKLMQRAFTPDFNLDGTLTEDPAAAPAVPMQRPEASLANHIGERLTADNVPVKGADVKSLTTQALGITDPEKWQVNPSQGVSGELGYHTLTHNGEDIGEFSTRENRFVLNPPSSSDMDRQQQRLINTSSDGLPVYFASDTPPLPKAAVSDMIRQGVDISRSSTDRAAVESKLAEAKLSPADLRQKVMNGELSVQDGRLLNETFHGIKDVDASKPAIEAAFGQHLTSPVLGPLFKKGDLTTRQGIVNQFMDAYAERAGSNIIAPNRSELAKLRSELLAKADPRGATGKGVDFALDLPKNVIAPLAGMIVEAVSVPLWYGPRKLLGYKDEAADIIYNGSRDLAQRQLNTANFVHRLFGQGEMKDILGELKTYSDKIQSVDDLPDEVAHKLRDAAYDGYHRFTDENAKDVNTTRDNYDIKKDPTLRAMFDRYLKTADGGTFDSMLQMLSMTANDRATQKQTMQYLERPQAATTDNVIERAKLLDMPLDEGKAAQVLTISKQLDSIKDEKQYKNLITQAGKVLGLEKPADVQMALSHLTREETDDPNSWRSLFRAGTVADAGEFATEIGSDILTGALTASIMGAPEAVALKGAQIVARQGLKRAFMAPVTALRDGFSKVVGGSLDSLAEKSARFGTGRAMLAKTGGELADKYRNLGITTPKFGQPLTAIQKGRNVAVGLAKSAVAAAPIEATEEGVSALLQANPNKEDLVNSMVMGALGGSVLVPMFAGAQSLNRAWQSGKRNRSITDYKTGLVDKFNQRMARQAGFTPLTVADFDIMQGIQDNPAHQTALQDHAAALEELGAATQEHTQNVMDYQDAAAGNAVPAIPESPRLLAAQSNAQRTAANVEGLSSMAFSATDELRALPDDQRPLYTGIAKAVSGATDYTEAEGKALIGLGGQSAVAFQQAQALPADVAGPANVTQLPGAPTVQQTGLGSYRLPAGVRIQVPPQAIAALQERAPSLTGLIGGQMPTPKQAASTPAATTQNAPQQNGVEQTTAQNGPETAPTPTPNRLTPALETRLNQHGLTVSYTPEEQAEVNQKWGPQSPFNIPPAFVQGGKGSAVAMPKDAAMDDTPIAENEVLSAVQNVVEKELRKRNTIAGRPLIVTSHYQSHDGGADYNYSNDTVRVNPLRLAISIWADRSTNPTRAEVARAAELVIDHEVVHAAQMQAARDTFAKLPAGQQAQGFIPWVAEHYGAMWRDDLKDVHDATMKIYGSVLEGRPDWHKAFEALRMIVQERTAGSTSEAATFLTDRLREHLKAALAVLKRWYADVMAGVADKPVIKAEIEAIEALLAKKSPQLAENGAKTPKSSTHLTLSAKDAAPILAFGESIPKDELSPSVIAEDGTALEDKPHVTVLFGLTKHEAAPVAAAIADHGPVTVTLGKMSIFENDEFDVLKIDVESPELRALNAKLSKLPNENSYPDYKPHMTIAYLKKGEGKKYVGDSRFAGKKITFDTMTFSPPSELRPELGKPELPLTKATPSLSVQIPLGKGGAKLDATFPDAESLAAFQFQDIIDAATKGKTPEERDAARQRGVSMLAAMMEDTPLSEPELRKKLQGYRESVIEQANAANPLQVFKPTPFHAYAKTDELASKSLPPPAGGDIISGMQGQGIRRIGPPVDSSDWSWYRELEADAANSKLKPGEAQRLARAGDVTDARARLAWINANVVSDKGRSIDEAAAELNASADQSFPVESGDQLGRAIMEALDARAKAKQGDPTTDATREQQAKDAAASFATLAAGAEGQPFTASQLSRSLENGDEIKIGGEIFTVSEVDPIDEYVRMESDRFGPVEITGEETVNLSEGANGKPVDSLASAPSRSRPRQTIVFNTPIQTPIGAINSYSWASKLEEVTDKSGEIVERRMSDWDKAVTNAETGRDIVHQFEVTQPDGSSKTVSLETALGKLSEGAKKDTIAILRAARRLPIREAELQALNTRREDYLQRLEYAQSEGWKSAPEPRLETPDFPPLAERGAKSVYVGSSWINNLEANELGQISDPQRIRQFKQQWATDQIRGLALNGTEQDKIASLQRGIRKDRELLKSNAVNAPVESIASAPSRYQSPTSMLAATQAQMQGAESEKPAGLNSMFNPKPRIPVTGERTLFQMPKPVATTGTAEVDIPAWKTNDGRTWQTEGEAKDTGLPYYNIEPEDGRMDERSTQELADYQRGKVIDLAPAADLELARKIVTNLNLVKEKRALLPNEQTAYDKATADIAAQDTLGSAPSTLMPSSNLALTEKYEYGGDAFTNAKGRYKHPVHLTDGRRLSGETYQYDASKGEMPTFIAYTKGGELITLQAQYVKPEMIESSRDDNKSANDLRDRLEKWNASKDTLASAPSQGTPTDLADAISAIESNAEDPSDADYWPENIAEAFANSPMQQGIENNDFATFYEGIPESLRTPQFAKWAEDSKAAETSDEDVNLDDAEAFLESDKAAKMAKAPFLPQVAERVASTIAQIEATGRHKWNAKTKTFDELDEPQVLYSAPSRVTPEQDAEYMQAVKDGDVAKQQKMVDAAAKAAGYEVEGFHGTDEKFTEFKSDAETRRDSGEKGKGFYFSPKEWFASLHGKHTGRFWVRLKNPFAFNQGSKQIQTVLDIAGPRPSGGLIKGAAEANPWSQKVRDGLMSLGYDGAVDTSEVTPEGIKRFASEFVVFSPNQIKSADPITRDAEGNVIPLSQRFNSNSDSILYSAPTESAPAQATPDNEAQVREIIASMPKVWQDVLKDFNAGKSVEDIAKDRLYTPEQTAHILSLAQGRFDYLRGALPTKPKVAPTPGGEPLFKGGRPDLAYSSIPAFAAVDQNRGTPEQVTHAEMQEAATRMFAIDPAAAEKLVTRWMDGGGMAFSVEDMPDGIKAIVADAQTRKASMALMTAAAQIFTVENAFAGGSSAKSARLIDLYRNSGEEFARALSQRRDVFETPAERNAWFLSEVLLTPPPSIRSEMKRNPANKAKILADWAARADQIKKELLAEGIDIDATMKQMAKERELAAATIPEAIKPAITQAPKSVRQLVKAILEGKSLKEAREAAGLTKDAAIKAYNGFRDAINKAGLKAAQVARDAMLGSAPSETDFAAQLGLPEWTEEMDESAPVVQSKATKALAIHRNRKMEGEIDLKNPLSVNKARVAMQLRKATGFDALSEYWRASILSGPLTAIVNVTSGLSYGAYEATFKKLSAAAMADVARLFGFKPDAPSLRDLPAMIAAVMPSMKEAGRDMIASWNTETTGFDAFASDDGLFAGTSSFKEQFDPALKGLLGKVMRGISFRHMGAADEFVKSFFTRIEVASQAAQIARNEGKTGEALATAMKDLMRPGSLAWERSLAQAKRITFQDQEVGRGKERRKLDSPLQPGHATIDVIDNLADAISRTKKGDFGNALKVLSHFVFPFVSTPTNIFKEGVTMSPMGGVLAIIDAARAAQRYSKGNKQEAARIYNAARAFNDITNQIVCWGFILGLSSLVKPGDGEDERPFITGGSGVGGDASSGERENAYRTAPPYSIRIGDTWHSYRRLDPFGSALAFMVDSIREFQSGKSIDKIWAKIGTGMLETMQDKTFMKSMSDVLNIMRDPERYGTRWFTGIATGFVPNLIRQPLRATDPVFRESDFPNDMGFVESVARRVGFGMFPSPSNPIAPIPAIDAFGREATKSTGTGQPGSDILLRLVSPIETREGSVGREGQPVDPLDVKILRYNMAHDKGFSFTAPPREITRTIGGKEIKISLTDEEYLDYEKKSGQGFHNAMKTIYGQKQGDFSEADFADINHLHARVMEPFGNDVFSKALRKRQAAGTVVQ